MIQFCSLLFYGQLIFVFFVDTFKVSHNQKNCHSDHPTNIPTMKKLKKRKKIGLALGGGVVLGAAHIGVLKAIEEFDIKISYLAGTSIGALIAALHAFGKTWEDIKTMALELDWFDISSLSISKYGLLSNKNIGEIIIKYLGEVTFEDANIPLAIVTTDIASGDKVILREGNIAKSVMASTCIPGVFHPIDIQGKLLVDGAIVENVPTTTVREMGAEIVVGVDLNAKNRSKKPENIVELLINAFDFTLMNASKLQTEDADILITPDLSSFNLIDRSQIPDLIEKGYNDAKAVLTKIVR
jgi:NTE family protein